MLLLRGKKMSRFPIVINSCLHQYVMQDTQTPDKNWVSIQDSVRITGPNIGYPQSAALNILFSLYTCIHIQMRVHFDNLLPLLTYSQKNALSSLHPGLLPENHMWHFHSFLIKILKKIRIFTGENLSVSSRNQRAGFKQQNSDFYVIINSSMQ